MGALKLEDQKVVRYGWRNHEVTTIEQTAGGGILAFLRVTGWFIWQTMDLQKHIAPMGGGGWMEWDVKEMKRLSNYWRDVETLQNGFEVAKWPSCHEDEDSDQGSNTTSTAEQHFMNRTVSVASTNGTSVDDFCAEEAYDVAIIQVPVRDQVQGGNYFC